MIKTIFTDFRINFSDGDLVSSILNATEIINGENTYIQIVLLRLLIPKGEYKLNLTLGSDLHILKTMKKSNVTQEMVFDIVSDALRIEINEGNIVLDSVEIDKNKSDEGILITVYFTIVGGNQQNVNFLISV